MHLTYEYKPTPWWQWILVPVVAVVAATAVTTLVLFLEWAAVLFMGNGKADAWFTGRAVPLLIGLSSGYCFSSAARRFAPSGGRVVACVLTLVLGAVLFMKVLGAWHHPELAFTDPLRMTIGAVAAVAGALLSLISATEV